MPPLDWNYHLERKDTPSDVHDDLQDGDGPMPWWLHVPEHGSEAPLSTAPKLSEPVAFEDFEYSFGLDPSVSIPIPLDMSPPALPRDLNDYEMNVSGDALPPLFVQPSDIQPLPPASNAPLLTDADQKNISQFLDHFFLDQDFEFNPALPDGLPNLSTSLPQGSEHSAERMFMREASSLPNIYLHDISPQLTSSAAPADDVVNGKAPKRRKSPTETWESSRREMAGAKDLAETSQHMSSLSLKTEPETRPSTTSEEQNSSKAKTAAKPRQKAGRDFLTDNEKRANHIASEQKRRNVIRQGFEDLTELVPSLSKVSYSKSTVLFKAVDYIRQLEARNDGLRSKLSELSARTCMQPPMHIFSPLPISPQEQSKPDPAIIPTPDSKTAIIPTSPQSADAARFAEFKRQLDFYRNLITAPKDTSNAQSIDEAIPTLSLDDLDKDPARMAMEAQSFRKRSRLEEDASLVAT